MNVHNQKSSRHYPETSCERFKNDLLLTTTKKISVFWTLTWKTICFLNTIPGRKIYFLNIFAEHCYTKWSVCRTLLHKTICLKNNAEQDDLFAEHCHLKQAVCRTVLHKRICLQNTAAQEDLFAEHWWIRWSVCRTLLHRTMCLQNTDARDLQKTATLDDMFAELCCTWQYVCRTLLHRMRQISKYCIVILDRMTMSKIISHRSPWTRFNEIESLRGSGGERE